MRTLAFLACGLLACSGDTFATGDAGGSDGETDDTAVPDAVVPDAGSVDACAPAPGACNTTDQRCTSFDDGTYTPPFDDLSTNGGTVSVDPTKSFSCPDGLKASMPPITTGVSPASPAIAAIGGKITLGGSPSYKITLELDVWLPSPSAVPTSFFAVGPPGDSADAVALTHDATGWHIHLAAEPEGSQDSDVSPPPLTEDWNHMKLTTNVSSVAATQTTLEYVDASRQTKTATAVGSTYGALPPPTSLGAIVGITVVTATPATVAFYDDVELTAD